MTLTFGTHKASCTHLTEGIYKLLYHKTTNEGSTWNLASIGLAVSKEMLNLSDLGPRSLNDLNL